MRRMPEVGNEPVLGALEPNVPSLRLATGLGFEPEARLVAFSPDARA